MKWNATILRRLVTLFFQSTRTDQNSSTKLYEILMCQIGPFGSGNWTIKAVFLFNVTYNTGRDKRVSPFNFFGIVRVFRKDFNVSKGSLLQFVWYFATEWMLKTTKCPFFQSASGLWRANSIQLLGLSGTVKKNTWHLKSFCYFWALEMVPTYAVSGSFQYFFSNPCWSCLHFLNVL